MSARRALVLGGGVIGVCSAYFLAGEGVAVTLLERTAIGGGCSFGNAGLVVPSHSIPLAAPGVWKKGLRWLLRRDSPFRIAPRLDPRLASWLWKFYRTSTRTHVERSLPVLRELSFASRRLFEELARAGLDFGYRRGGVLVAFRTEEGFAEGAREAHTLSEAGIEARVLDSEALTAAEPWLRPGLAGGILFPDDAQLVPDRFVASLAELASRRGVELRLGVDVQELDARDGRIRGVRTGQEYFAVEADTEVVLAAGVWSAALARGLGTEVPLQAGKGYSVTFEPEQTLPRTPLILGEERVAVTPMESRLRLSGTLELAGPDTSVDECRARGILRAADRWARDHPIGAKAQPFWAGLRPCSPDGLPIVGRLSAISNLILATGHGMLGVSLGPITGRIVADLVTGREPAFAMRALDPARFAERVGM